MGIEFETVEAEDCPTREAAIAWIAANQLGRRNLTPSQKAALALELEKQLAEAAKLRRRATQNNDAGRAVLERFPEQEKGEAREKAAAMVVSSTQLRSNATKFKVGTFSLSYHFGGSGKGFSNISASSSWETASIEAVYAVRLGL